MGYGLSSPSNDLSLADIAALCDVFYIGGTKCGALFGEAVVISNAVSYTHLDVYKRQAMDIGNRLKSSVRKYINGHYVAEQALLSSPARPPVPLMNSFSREEEGPAVLKEDPAGYRDRRTLKELLARRNETFSRMLLRLIDDKGLTDVQVYKKANIDRKLFSKIRSSESYAPSKRTALSLAIALELSLDEARDLLMRAGYAPVSYTHLA